MNPAIRWFAGFGMSEALPDHSSLMRIRQRWGANPFRAIFARVVRECQLAGLVSGDVVHMGATLIRADVSLGSRDLLRAGRAPHGCGRSGQSR
ncbi:MAG: transposase [Cypionkella sp.]